MNTLIIFSEVLPNTSRDLRLLVSVWHYSGFGIKNAQSFGYAKTSKYKTIFPLSQMSKSVVVAVTSWLSA